MRLIRAIAVLLVPCALLGACGGDDDDSGDGASATTPAEADPAADQALAEQVVLTLEDLGPGWEITQDEEDEEDEEDPDDQLVEDELAACLEIDPDDVPDDTDDPEASVTFEQEVAQIESSASVSPSLEEIEATFALFDSGRFPECYGELFEAEMARNPNMQEEEGFTFTGVDVTELDLPSGLGDGAVGLRAVLSAEAEGLEFEVFQDIYFVRRGRVGITLMALNLTEPLDQAFTQQLVTLMDERAAGA